MAIPSPPDGGVVTCALSARQAAFRAFMRIAAKHQTPAPLRPILVRAIGTGPSAD